MTDDAIDFASDRAGVVFPPRLFQLAIDRIEARSDDLLPAERAALQRAVPARLATYAAGRRCARRALRQLDAASGSGPRKEAPLLRDAQGCPLWPSHAAGSISHSPQLAIAVVAERACARAIGVDLEALDRGVAAGTLECVFAASEREWLAAQPEHERHRLAYAVFAAREALYKCVYHACGHALAPGEVELQLAVPHGAFCARWHGAARALDLPARLPGRFVFDGLHVLAGVWCPPAVRSPRKERNRHACHA